MSGLHGLRMLLVSHGLRARCSCHVRHERFRWECMTHAPVNAATRTPLPPFGEPSFTGVEAPWLPLVPRDASSGGGEVYLSLEAAQEDANDA
jgi:hypothetical protein